MAYGVFDGGGSGLGRRHFLFPFSGFDGKAPGGLQLLGKRTEDLQLGHGVMLRVQRVERPARGHGRRG